MTLSPAVLLSAAFYLCRAADDLRAAGLNVYAEEIESLMATVDAELAVAGVACDEWDGDI